MINFPEEYDPKAYLNFHKDLIRAKFNAQDLKKHFEIHGKNEGRVSNSIQLRANFIELIPKEVATLEIGPFYNPVVKGENVKYFDVLSQQDLVARAKSIGTPYENIPPIDFVDPQGNLAVVNEQFDIVVSCHCIEHQPDLVNHLQKVENLLNPGGYYFIIIPDKRYCFDHFIPETTIAEVIYRHHEKAKTHSLKSVIEHRALTTHNDPSRHWAGDHGQPHPNFEENVKGAIKEYEDAKGAYIDVHASYFTPDSFTEIVSKLYALNVTKLKIIRTYHTRRGQNEFFAIMNIQNS